MKIAIVTVNYNRKDDTLAFFNSLKILSSKNYNLLKILVDNGSTDQTVKWVLEKFPDVEILQNGQNFGFAGGFNRGIRYAYQAGCDYVLVINNDTEILDPDFLKKQLEIFKTEKEVGIVCPKILFAKGFEFHKDRYTESELGKVIWYGGGRIDFDNIQGKHLGIDEVDSGQFDQVQETEFATGCSMLLSKNFLEKVRGFNEDYFAYFEDLELNLRAREQGFKIYYCGKTFLFHKVAQTSTSGSRLTDYYTTRNRLILGMKYTSSKTKFALLRESLKFLIFGRSGQKKGVIDYFKKTFGPMEKQRFNDSANFPTLLSINILNYKTTTLIKNLLTSIYDSRSGYNSKNMEIILVDNSPEEPCLPEICKLFPSVKFIKNKVNTGFTKGHNQALEYSKGKYYLLLNSDIEVLPDTISEILKVAQEKNGSAVLGGKLFFPGMLNQDSVFKLPTIWGAIKEYFLGIKGAYRMYLPGGENPTKVEGIVMAVTLIPQKVLNLAGILDTGTFIYFEDLEYSRRLKKLGVPIYFVPKAKFIHLHGASSKLLPEGEAYERLKKASIHYHGKLTYNILYLVLRAAQLLRLTNVERFTSKEEIYKRERFKENY